MRAVEVKKRMIERRTEALFKKAEELSVLCGSEIGIVIVSPTETGPIVWPAVEATTKIFLAFMAVPEGERVKRMVVFEEYMRGRVNEEIGKMRRMEEEVERMEMNVLMKEVIAGRKSLTEMDARQLKGLYALADDKMVELENRKQELLAEQNDGGAARPLRRRRNRRERNHRAAPPDATVEANGSAGGGSYYIPQPPAPLYDSWWTTPPAPVGELPSIPIMAAMPPPLPQGSGGGEGSYQQMFFSAGGGSLPTNNGGGNSVAATSAFQVPSLSEEDWVYNFFPWSI